VLLIVANVCHEKFEAGKLCKMSIYIQGGRPHQFLVAVSQHMYYVGLRHLSKLWLKAYVESYLTRWGRVFLRSQQLLSWTAGQEIPASIEARTRHWSLSRARRIQSTYSHPIPLSSILILYSRPHLEFPWLPYLKVFRPQLCMHFSFLCYRMIYWLLIWSSYE
jgi:hypothetical protein